IEELRPSSRRSARSAARPPGLLRASTSLDVPSAVRLLAADPSVAFAEPNYRCTHASISNDTYYSNGALWGACSDDQPTAVGPANTTNAYGSQAEKAWGAGNTGSASIYVGVVDEGIDVDHPDLQPNVWTNPFDPPDG